MTTPVSPAKPRRQLADSDERRISAAVMAGMALGIAGLVLGLVMALHSVVIECPNGTIFPEGTTDHRCFSHPHAGEGVGLMLVAGMLMILILLAAWLVRMVADPSSHDTTAEPAA